MTTVRMQRLDADGGLVGEPTVLTDITMSFMPAEPDLAFDCCVPVITTPHRLTMEIASPKSLTRLLLGPRLALKWQRAQRHRARIVVVPKRRRKHGRIGVYR